MLTIRLAIRLICIWLHQLLFDVCSNPPQVLKIRFSNLIKPRNIKGNYAKRFIWNLVMSLSLQTSRINFLLLKNRQHCSGYLFWIIKHVINRAVFANYNVVISKTHFSAWSEVQSSTSTKKLYNFYCQQESKKKTKNKTRAVRYTCKYSSGCFLIYHTFYESIRTCYNST